MYTFTFLWEAALNVIIGYIPRTGILKKNDVSIEKPFIYSNIYISAYYWPGTILGSRGKSRLRHMW